MNHDQTLAIDSIFVFEQARIGWNLKTKNQKKNLIELVRS